MEFIFLFFHSLHHLNADIRFRNLVEHFKKNYLDLDCNKAEFPSTTFGAVPVIWQFLKVSSWRGLGSGFSIFRIINVIADLTLVSFQGIIPY
jgi:hypothetical protein